MRHKFFLAYLPLMILMGFISIWVAKRYNGVATMSGYRIDKSNTAGYDGIKIKDLSSNDRKALIKQDKYNGSAIHDNGKPYAIKVNKKANVVTVYEVGDNGYYNKPVKAMLCSVGEADNTPEGIFGLGDRFKWRELFGDCYGQYAVSITGNILFHSVPYYTRDKANLEVEEYNNLGKSVSAGCVRLSVIDAKWVYDNCSKGTIVEIYQSDYEGPLGRPQALQIEKKPKDNWDPTDPDENNPYMKDLPVIIGAYDKVIDRYSDFDITAGVTVLDKEGKDITGRMKISGVVDNEKCGNYPVTYSISTEDGKETSVTATFTVKDDESPILEVNQLHSTIAVSDTVSNDNLAELLKENVTAFDSGEELSNDYIIVDYSEVFEKTYGKCNIRYRAQDSEGNFSDVVVLSVDVDLEAPTLTLKNEYQREIKRENAEDDNYLLSLVEAKDNSKHVELSISKPLKYDNDEPYKVMYYAKDAVGNITTLSVSYQLK